MGYFEGNEIPDLSPEEQDKALKTIIKFFGKSKRFIKARSLNKAMDYKNNKNIENLTKKNICSVMQFYIKNKQRVLRTIQKEFNEFKPMDKMNLVNLKMKQKKEKKEVYKDAPFPYNILRPTPEPIISQEEYDSLMQQATELFDYPKIKKKKMKSKKLKFDVYSSIKRSINKEANPYLISTKKSGFLKDIKTTFGDNFFKRANKNHRRLIDYSKRASAISSNGSQSFIRKNSSYRKKYFSSGKMPFMTGVRDAGSVRKEETSPLRAIGKKANSVLFKDGVYSRSFRGSLVKGSLEFPMALVPNLKKETATCSTRTREIEPSCRKISAIGIKDIETSSKKLLTGPSQAFKISKKRILTHRGSIKKFSPSSSSKNPFFPRQKRSKFRSKSKTSTNFYPSQRLLDQEEGQGKLISKFSGRHRKKASKSASVNCFKRSKSFKDKVVELEKKKRVIVQQKLKKKKEKYLQLHRTCLSKEFIKRGKSNVRKSASSRDVRYDIFRCKDYDDEREFD